jgi:PTS system nitrogen regulatory IIA component
MDLSEIITPQMVIPELEAKDKVSVLTELVEPLVEKEQHLDKDRIVAVLLERERLGSTGIGEGIAIPHGKIDTLEELLISFGRSKEGVAFDSMDGQPAHLFFLLIAPEHSAGSHLKALAKLSRLLKDAAFREELFQAPDAEAIYNLIIEHEKKV